MAGLASERHLVAPLSVAGRQSPVRRQKMNRWVTFRTRALELPHAAEAKDPMELHVEYVAVWAPRRR